MLINVKKRKLTVQFNEEKVISNIFNVMKYPSDAPEQCHAIFEHFEDQLIEEETEKEEVDEDKVEGNNFSCVSMKLELLVC